LSSFEIYICVDVGLAKAHTDSADSSNIQNINKTFLQRKNVLMSKYADVLCVYMFTRQYYSVS